MTRRRWRSSRTRLERCAGEMLASLRHVQQRHWGGEYVHGLLLAGPRKAFTPMARYLGEPDGQAFQQLVSTSPWEWEPVRERAGKAVSQAPGKGGAWIVDDTSFPKRGEHSVGVAPQYCGALGKTANCQSAALSGDEDPPGPGRVRGPGVGGMAPPRDAGDAGFRLRLAGAAAGGQKGGAKPTFSQVLHWLQYLLLTREGTCLCCGQRTPYRPRDDPLLTKTR